MGLQSDRRREVALMPGADRGTGGGVMLTALLKATAPVVAIPIEGDAPLCFDGKRLRAWAKGIKRYPAQIIWSPEDVPLARRHEGPLDLVAVQVLFVKHDRGWAKFLPIPRNHEALSRIWNWSDKERERQAKKSLTVTLTTAQRKALKRAKYDEDGDGMISIMVAGNEGKTQRMGIPVEIPEFPLLSFAVVRFGTDSDDNISFTVTETITGRKVDAGDTAEHAVLDARQKATKLSPDQRAKITAKCFEDAA
jgi:hypothetical protein